MLNGNEPNIDQVKAITTELNEAMKLDMRVNDLLQKLPLNGTLLMCKKTYVVLLKDETLPIFLKSRLESAMIRLQEDATLIGVITGRLQILYPDPLKAPPEAQIPVTIIKTIILNRYLSTSGIVAAYQYNKFHQAHGLEIESMLSKLGLERNKGITEEWLVREKSSSIIV